MDETVIVSFLRSVGRLYALLLQRHPVNGCEERLVLDIRKVRIWRAAQTLCRILQPYHISAQIFLYEPGTAFVKKILFLLLLVKGVATHQTLR